jgi:hypothetical protein
MGKTTPKVTIRTPQTSKEGFLWGFYYYYNPLNFNQLYLIGWRATRRKTLGGMGQAWGRHGAGEQPYRGLGRDLGQGYWVGIRLSNDLANDLARERRQDGAKCLKGLALEAVPHGSSRRPPLACQGGGFSSSLRPSQRAPVAQLDRAPDYESGGWEFESLRAHHILNE